MSKKLAFNSKNQRKWYHPGMTTPNRPGAGQRRLSFNPEATPFNPTAPAFQPAVGTTTTTTRCQQPIVIATPPFPLQFGSTPLQGLGGIRPARNVGGLPAHTMSAAEVVSPSPKRVELAAKTLEAHPMVHGFQPSVRLHEGSLQRKVELDMAKRDPSLWAALADAGLKSLDSIYHPGPVPPNVLEDHYAKFPGVYDNQLQSQSGISSQKGLEADRAATRLTHTYTTSNATQGLPGHLKGLAKAHASAYNGTLDTKDHVSLETDPTAAFQNTPPNQQLARNLDTRSVSGPSGGFNTADSTASSQSATPVSLHKRRTSQGTPGREPQPSTPFSPGLAFPPLSSQPTKTPTTAGAHERAASYTSNGASSWRVPRGAASPYMRIYNTPLTDFLTPVSRSGRHRRGNRAGAKKSRTPRFKRTDQGPMPSNADIYPDDTLYEHGQSGTQFGMVGHLQKHENLNDFGLTMIPEELEAERVGLQRAPNFETGSFYLNEGFMDGPSTQNNGPDPYSPQQEARPKLHAFPSYLREELNAVATELNATTEGIVDGISDLHISPLTSRTEDGRSTTTCSKENECGDRTPRATVRADGHAKRPLASLRELLDPDQVDGSRYGLEFWGIGLHMVGGSVWMPPEKKSGTAFDDVAYLWAKF